MAENEVGTALITVPEEKVRAIFTTADGIKPILADIAGAIKDWTSPGVETEAARAQIKSMAFKLTRSRTYIEALGKKEADAAKLLPKVIDANRRLAKDTIQEMEDRIRGPLDEWEAKEKARIDDHRTSLAGFDVAIALYGDNASDAKEALDRISAFEISDDKCQEFIEEYRIAKEDAVEKLTAIVAQREQHEKDQAELAQLRAQQAERQRIEQEATAAREKAAEAARAAEAAEERRRADIAAAEERVRQEERWKVEREEAARKEAARLEAEAAERQRREEERRASNRRHQAAINSKAVAALVDVLSAVSNTAEHAEIARAIVIAIARGEVPAMTIKY